MGKAAPLVVLLARGADSSFRAWSRSSTFQAVHVHQTVTVQATDLKSSSCTEMQPLLCTLPAIVLQGAWTH